MVGATVLGSHSDFQGWEWLCQRLEKCTKQIFLPWPSLCLQPVSWPRPAAHCGFSGWWAVGIGSSSLHLLSLPPPPWPVSTAAHPVGQVIRAHIVNFSGERSLLSTSPTKWVLLPSQLLEHLTCKEFPVCKPTSHMLVWFSTPNYHGKQTFRALKSLFPR